MVSCISSFLVVTDPAHCFFDPRGCFWSVVHRVPVAVLAQGAKEVADSNRQEKNQLPKLMKMTPRLISYPSLFIRRGRFAMKESNDSQWRDR
jgi:hypothetical protein